MGDDFQNMSDMNDDDVEFEEPKKKGVATDDDGLGDGDTDTDDSDDDMDDDAVDFNDTEMM